MVSYALRILILIATLVISGCAATGPAYSELKPIRENTGILYIYRPAKFLNSAVSPGIIIDEQEYAVLPHGGYMVFELDAGIHNIGLKLSDRYSGSASIGIQILPHTSAYVLLDTWNENAISFALKPQVSDTAIEVINTCKRQDSNGPRFSKSFFWSNN